jgi:HTH-type transcriptional regulator / antitoxin HigA
MEYDDFFVVPSGLEENVAVSEFKSYLQFKEVIKKLPLNEMINRGWIDSKDDEASFLTLYKSINGNKFTTLFRKGHSYSEALAGAWLARVHDRSRVQFVMDEMPRFSGLSKENLREIAQLSVDENVLLRLPKILAGFGIILVYEKALPRMKMDGVVFLSEMGNPVIGISFRYPRLDNFWFTLMHELSHVSLHYDQLKDPIFQDLNVEMETLIEQQADRLAKNSFVKRSDWRNCKPKYDSSDKAVFEFAQSVNIHPAIIAGLLQNELKIFHRYRKIVDVLNTRELVFPDG